MQDSLKQGLLKQVSRSQGGLPKRAVPEPVMMDSCGVAGDVQRATSIHGGPGKAVLMMSAELIDALSARGFPIYYGALGENLTVSGLDPHLWRAGQRYRIGEDAVIELTTLRSPCGNLNLYGPSIKAELYDDRCKQHDVASPHWAHGGFYARVVRPGLLVTGAPVVLEADVA
jgi:MOSC domain-containing protein YiiM